MQEVADLAAAGKFDYLIIESTGELATILYLKILHLLVVVNLSASGSCLP